MKTPLEDGLKHPKVALNPAEKAREARRVVAALIGQPNVGKSTLFNALTKGNVIVTNWPGTTVEKHEGRVYYNGYEVVLVDLPGVYGLTGLTPEERISRDYLVRGRPDVVVVLADSLALERTLYLVVEVLELTGRVVIAVTKVDETHKRGIHVNYEQLSKTLGVPIVPVSAIKGSGLQELLKTIADRVGVESSPLRLDYGELEPFIEAIAGSLERVAHALPYPARWAAIKVLEGDVEILEEVRMVNPDVALEVEEVRAEAARRLGQDLVVFTSKKRFEYAGTVARACVARLQIRAERERVEKVFYNPLTGLIASLGILLGVFVVVFTVNTGYPLTLLLEYAGLGGVATVLEEYSLTGLLGKATEYVSEAAYSVLGSTALARFLVEGVLSGLLAVFSLVPLVLVVLVVLAVFEDTGLLTRMAVGFHNTLSKFGLTGHIVFPISLCLGCNVPGIMATRSNLNTLERLRLTLLLPFIPCQARLVVLLAVASAIGGFTGAILIPLAYLASFTIVVLLNMLLVKTAERRGVVETRELLLELPPLHRPIPRVVWWFTWFYLKHFLMRVGTLVLAVNVVVWFLSNTNPGLELVEDPGESLAAGFARTLTPMLKPLGVSGDRSWVVVYALITGFLAKELFLTTLLAATGATSFREAVELVELSGASTASLALFTVLYVPCIASIATVYLETRRFKYAVYTVALMLFTAYVVSTATYYLLELVS